MKIDGRTLDHATLEQIRLMAIRRVREGRSAGAAGGHSSHLHAGGRGQVPRDTTHARRAEGLRVSDSGGGPKPQSAGIPAGGERPQARPAGAERGVVQDRGWPNGRGSTGGQGADADVVARRRSALPALGGALRRQTVFDRALPRLRDDTGQQHAAQGSSGYGVEGGGVWGDESL